MNTYKWPPPKIETIPANPDAETPITDALVLAMQAGWLSLGSSAPGAVKPLIEMLEVFERENADLKQRLLPQYLGRAERAENVKRMVEHDRDSLLEQLLVAEKRVADQMTNRTDAATVRMERLDGDIDEVVSADFARTLERELIAARSATAAPDRPDWARQLPGAEIYDRAAQGDHGYDRMASLSAGRYVCTCGGACSRPDASRPSPTTKEQP